MFNPIEDTNNFLKSLGFPQLHVHHSSNHFDFSKASRRMLVIGPMGSGKTEYSARVWRDSQVALTKSEAVVPLTKTGEADRRNVGFFRNSLDAGRFPDYPADALAYRGGYVQLGKRLFLIEDSFQLEEIIDAHEEIGTWIIDEASFYDERLAYVVRKYSEEKGLSFIFPTLILNFRKDIFNPTARLILENSTDVFPLTAYCEHADCLKDSFYTYRYYKIDDLECPALFFDPLIIIGGDKVKEDPYEPNYCTRCDHHHYLPGKEYTFLFLKPAGERAMVGDDTSLKTEIEALKNSRENSVLFQDLYSRYIDRDDPLEIQMNALKVPALAERALIYLYGELNLLSSDYLKKLVNQLSLDKEYMRNRLRDNGRRIEF